MTTPAYTQAHALIIGVSKYRRITALPDAVINDATDVSATLASSAHCGYDPAKITTLLDQQATRSGVLDALGDLSKRAGADDTVCVFFSGHGGLRKGASDSWLLTVECDTSDLANTAISAAELTAALHTIRAKRLLVFIDACHAGGAAALKGDSNGDSLEFGYAEKSLAQLGNGTGRVLIASSRMSEKSWVMPGERNSAFTKALLAGLKGAADPGHGGYIKVFSLFDYLSEEVPKATIERQHPIFKATDIENNFAVALSRGGAKGSAANSKSAPQEADRWARLERALIQLYPTGPNDQELWSRAGGDRSRLAASSTGAASWHAALRTLKQGGGGRIHFESLVKASLEDFALNHALLDLDRGAD